MTKWMSRGMTRGMPRRLFPLALLLLPLTGSCGGGTDPGAPVGKVVLVGIESLSLLQVETMVARGELPNFSRLLERGARARTVSPDPLVAPMLWSTLLTGQDAIKHQMTAAYVNTAQGIALAPSSMRTSPTLFQILGQEHQLVASLGFPGTWPAEALNGFNLAHGALPSRFVQASEHSFVRTPGDRDAFPESLLERATGHYTPVAEMDRADTAPFFVLNEEEFTMLYDRPLGSIYRLDNPPRDFAISLQRDAAQVALAQELLGEFPLRLVGVHLELADALQSVYWRAAWPDHYTIRADAQRRFSDTIDECYRRLDTWIGELMQAAGEDAIICVVGDRGFGHGSNEMTGPDEEREIFPTIVNESLLLLHGPGIRRGADLGTVHLVDVAPTLLSALDLPVGVEMDGSVLDAAFSDEFLSAHPRKGTESWTGDFRSSMRYPSELRQAAEQSAAESATEETP
ncbi:hypothetical protein DRQ32_04370 [bacterium]|nr:MAG: hypothetical protein DRQ32_04370 [bacterium]